MKIRYQSAHPKHAREICAELRELDADAMRTFRADSVAAVESNIHRSAYSMAAYVDGALACLWGVLTPTLLDNRGLVWMLTTPAMEQAPLIIGRRCQIELQKLLETYSPLYGFVDVRNERSIRWLRWMKFDLKDTVEIRGLRAHYFERNA